MNGEGGVTFTYGRDGRPSGEAYVQLSSEDDVKSALAHNRQHIGSRYVESMSASQATLS